MATSLPDRPTSTGEEELDRMSLLEHLEDLRKRLLYSVIALAVAFIPCWMYVQKIFAFLAAPIQKIQPGLKLAFLGLTDPFILYFKVAALAAVFIASPFILFQVWAFVAPGLYRRERLFALPFVLCASFFFVAGGAFAYYITFPFAAKFLLAMGEGFQAVITLDRYTGFLLTLILGLGLMFELPIFLVLLAMVGVVSSRFLLRYFRHAVVLIFIAAAIITPTPDIVNLCLFAVPTIGLYVLGMAGVFVVERTRRKRAEKESADEAEE